VLASIHIEPMTEGDLKEVLALEARAFPDPWNLAQFKAELDNPHAEILLARQGVTPQGGGVIVGYIAFWHIVDEIQILDVAVDPHMQRRGIGRALLDYVVQIGEEAQCITWSLEVRASNEAARRLYTGAGFQIVNTRRGYYAHGGEDAFIMVRGHVPGT
jgi:ribosomal-protein-alanine N-acetyltransferase